MVNSRANYDTETVFEAFLNHQMISNSERQELLRITRDGIWHSHKSKMLLAEVCQEAADQRLDPVNCIALGMNFGMVLGILLERERNERLRKDS